MGHDLQLFQPYQCTHSLPSPSSLSSEAAVVVGGERGSLVSRTRQPICSDLWSYRLYCKEGGLCVLYSLPQLVFQTTTVVVVVLCALMSVCSSSICKYIVFFKFLYSTFLVHTNLLLLYYCISVNFLSTACLSIHLQYIYSLI